MSDIVIFEADAQQVEVRLEGETLWLTLQQLAELFGRDKSVISRHLKKIFDTNELERYRTVAKNATVQKERLEDGTADLWHDLVATHLRSAAQDPLALR